MPYVTKVPFDNKVLQSSFRGTINMYAVLFDQNGDFEMVALIIEVYAKMKFFWWKICFWTIMHIQSVSLQR